MATAMFVFARPPTGGKGHIADAWLAFRYYLDSDICHMTTSLPLKRGVTDTIIHVDMDAEHAYVICQLSGPPTLPIKHSVPGVTHVRIISGTVVEALASLRASQLPVAAGIRLVA